MTDIALVLLAGVLVTFVPFDLYVWRAFRVEARRDREQAEARDEEPIVALQLFASVLAGIAAGALIGAVLAVHTIVFNWSNGTVRLLPVGLPALLIAGALLVISIPVIPLFRQLRRWQSERIAFRIHRRNGEASVTPHRRSTDVPADLADDPETKP